MRGGSYAGANYGGAAQLQAKTNADPGLNRQSYLKFTLPAATPVTTATLRLFGKLSDFSRNLPVGVFGVADASWGESTINFNNQPATGAAALATATVADNVERWYAWDLTAYVRDRQAAGEQVMSVALKHLGGGSANIQFRSKEATSLGPQLVIS